MFKHNTKYKWSNTCDKATLEGLGYEINNVKICASCGKKAKKDCCGNFSKANRRNKIVIENMVIRNGFEEDLDYSEPEF